MHQPFGSSSETHHSTPTAPFERQRMRRPREDISTSERRSESPNRSCVRSSSYQNSQVFENSAYFIPGISGKARCLTDAAPPLRFAEPERDSQIMCGDCRGCDDCTNTTTNKSVGTNSTRVISATESRKRSKHCESSAKAGPTTRRQANASIQCQLRRSLSQIQSMSSTSVSTNLKRADCNESVTTMREWNDGGSCCSTRSMLLRNQLASVRSMLHESSSPKRIK